MNFRYRLMQFMSGRYGPDKLTFAIIGVSFIISFINVFVRAFGNLTVYIILQLSVYVLLGIAIFRFLSRNIFARQRENEKFCNALYFIKTKRELYNKRKADKCHVYRKCPHCRATLRLPHRIGKHSTVCPRCGFEFTVKVRK